MKTLTMMIFFAWQNTKWALFCYFFHWRDGTGLKCSCCAVGYFLKMQGILPNCSSNLHVNNTSLSLIDVCRFQESQAMLFPPHSQLVRSLWLQHKKGLVKNNRSMGAQITQQKVKTWTARHIKLGVLPTKRDTWSWLLIPLWFSKM